MLQAQTYVIQTVEQGMAAARVDFKFKNDFLILVPHPLRLQVHAQLHSWILFGFVQDPLNLFFGQPDGQQPILHTVVVKNVGEAGRNEDVKDRLLFSQVLEAIRIMEEGVLTSVGDGNIGSIMGIGFPPHTGGVYQCVNAYGVQAFADRASELAQSYGEVFQPPGLLLEMAAEGKTFA